MKISTRCIINSGSWLVSLWAILWHTSLLRADTFSHGRIDRQLQSADLVAEILVVGRTAHAHPVHYTVTHSEALLERIVEARTREAGNVRVGDRVVIESLGGERNGVGLHISGYPRPYKGQRYLAHLNRIPSGVYIIAGFHHGLSPLAGDRAYSRNRTDGSNGEGNGAYLRWDSVYFPIPYFIDATSFEGHEEYVPAIDAAFASWRNPKDIKVEFVAVGCTRNARVENDGVNNVMLLKSGWPFDSDAIAINRSFYIASSEPRAGVILDSDIILNGESHKFTTTNEPGHHDVQNIVTHEVGHLLGLGHEVSPQDSRSAMYPFANPNETNKRVLSDNDLAGAKEIYRGVGDKLQTPSTEQLCSISHAQAQGCASAHLAGPCSPLQLSLVQWITCLIQVGLLGAGLAMGRYLRCLKY